MTCAHKKTVLATLMPAFLNSFWRNKELWLRLTERDILGRYRGSTLGIGWSFVNPLAMLAVYTFIFSQVFKARWGGLEEGGAIGFAINLFAGLIVFNLFSECVSKGPSLITGNPNYVKKVIFPLDLLSWVALGSAVFHALIGLIILIAFELLAFHRVPSTLLWLPLVWLPLIAFTLACTMALSSVGVFLRDIGQAIGICLNMLMFLSPIFFPLSALPARWQPVLGLNPIARVIEQTRIVLVIGDRPSVWYIVIGTAAAIMTCELSYLLFKKSQNAFSDVL